MLDTLSLQVRALGWPSGRPPREGGALIVKISGGIAIAATVLILAATSVDAHHGWGGYDTSKILRLTGTIRDSSYEHPHGMLRLAVDTTVWDVVLAPPSRMQVRGLTKDMLAVGTRATVVGYPHRTTPGEMRAERITIDGRTTELR
jgi:hypothetical protein